MRLIMLCLLNLQVCLGGLGTTGWQEDPELSKWLADRYTHCVWALCCLATLPHFRAQTTRTLRARNHAHTCARYIAFGNGRA